MHKLLLPIIMLALLSCPAVAQDEAAQAEAEAAAEVEQYMPTVGAIEFIEIPAIDVDAAADF